MEEIWEVIKSVNTQQGVMINTEICNNGNVRIVSYYKDKEIKKYYLTLGKGLYVSYSESGPNIRIVKCGGDIYRHVYFMKHYNHEYIKGHQIHHIDYNHCNNIIDNLLYCSPKEHGLYHAFQYKLANEAQGYQQDWSDNELKQLELYNKAKEYYKWLEDNKNNFSIDKATEYIRQIRKEIEQIAKPLIEQYKLDKVKQREERKKEREQERINKLNSGNYKEVNGKLVYIHTISDYQKQQMAEGRRRKCYNNQEWRDKCRDGLLRYLQENDGHYNKR